MLFTWLLESFAPLLVSLMHVLSHLVKGGTWSAGITWFAPIAITTKRDTSVGSLSSGLPHALLRSTHDLIKVFVAHVISLLTNALLQQTNLVHVIALLLMLCFHLEVLEGLMELLVLSLLLLLFECLDFDLLFQKSALDLGHVSITFEHLS